MATKIICVDAGHGYNTGGRRCLKKFDPAEHREWWLNDRIADLVETELLRDFDCKVVRADDTTGAKDISLSNRVKTANNANANMYISIHHNAGINGGNGGGTIVYSYKNEEDKARALRLYNKIIAQTNLVGNRANKTAVSGFYVIDKTKCPSLLCELGFMDSATDVPIILTEDYAKKASTGIVNFLVAELGLKKKVVEVKPTVTQTVAKPDTTTASNVIGTAVAKQTMNVRNGASVTNTQSIGHISKGQTVEVLEVLSNGWYKIVWNNSFAYTSNASNAYYTYTAKGTSTANQTASTQYYPKCDKKYTTISTALTSIGVDSSYSFRRKIARANNIGGLGGISYAGTAQQNTQMLNLLKAGLLIKA